MSGLMLGPARDATPVHRCQPPAPTADIRGHGWWCPTCNNILVCDDYSWRVPSDFESTVLRERLYQMFDIARPEVEPR